MHDSRLTRTVRTYDRIAPLYDLLVLQPCFLW